MICARARRQSVIRSYCRLLFPGVLWLAVATTASAALFVPPHTAPPRSADVIIYGGTAAGVTAAVQTARMGHSVILIEPTRHIGGLTSGGLGFTDSGDKRVIGGLSREFYQRVRRHYDDPAAWDHERPADYARYRASEDAMWTFEPRVAEQILRFMLSEARVPVIEGERLDRKPGGVRVESGRIEEIRMESGLIFSGRQFIDATYEGDLMAAAGVSYTVGREANSVYSETLNGNQVRANTHNHRFLRNVSPFRIPGDRSSGLLPGVEDAPAGEDGTGDHRVQAYCFRMCMSNSPNNRRPFPKPDGYREEDYELLLRNFEAGDLRFPMKPDMMPNRKTDTNNNCAVSTDCIGANYRYPDADYAEREAIISEHRRYQQGFMWTLANHPRVPQSIRDEMSQWGLPLDEFTDNDNWPHQLYIREARRMVSDYVVTESDCRRERLAADSVGLGSYNMDSHNVRRFLTADGHVQNEGDVQASPGGAYLISWRSLIPRQGQVTNLTVPVCLSSSHIAYGSIRMEPVFMVLGQSAATAAVLAIRSGVALQDLAYATLRQQLIADQQVLDLPPQTPARPLITKASLPGVVLDDVDAQLEGVWSPSSSTPKYVGVGYVHDANEDKSSKTATWTLTAISDGPHQLNLAYSPNPNRATNVPVRIRVRGREQQVSINQRQTPPLDGLFVTAAVLQLKAGDPVDVQVRCEGTDGHVIVDGIQLLPQAP
ncbi:MAG: FAD-dependent oxidoreductase [Planctomycetota bacterium]